MAPLLSLSGGRPAAVCPAPLSSPAHPFQVYAFGRGRGAAPGAGCGLPPAGQPGGGGWEGRPVRRPSVKVARGPGGRGVVCLGPSLCPPPGGQHCGRHWRRSGHGGTAPILLRFVVVRRPSRGLCAVLAPWCGFARLPRPPRGQAVGGVGARGVRFKLRPPPGVTVPSGGGETPSRRRGG